MTTTEIATITRNDFIALQEGSEIREAMEANLQSGEKIKPSDLIHVSVPAGGGTTWQWEDVTGEVSCKEIEGALVYIQSRGTLWPSEEPSEGTLPLLVSYDLVSAAKVGDDFGDIDERELEKHRRADGLYNWPSLPWNEFGSSGYGKRCKENRLLYVLRKDDAWPICVVASPGSLQSVGKFIRELTRAAVPHYRAYVRLTLEKAESKSGIKYSQIKCSLVPPPLSRELGELLRKSYSVPLSRVASQLPVDRDDLDD